VGDCLGRYINKKEIYRKNINSNFMLFEKTTNSFKKRILYRLWFSIWKKKLDYKSR